ncbi:hypothetical protein [Papillibacter cinnamivorans]|uniref:Uncharacterized protein n=1 Tax=Papillibacter cinnamivorans DSM 12816 TaxID=1122930 RepID=A0A1W1ZHI6_9FIRM|nr:hypothetical protein [Papillibacter cinnamivorans]SMC47939.1 hypothetical protein SAMN02745168_1113 [Papillibacter cinnamivorans DSM 12816]
MEDAKTIVYLCPVCRQPVTESRTAFALQAGPQSIACSCKDSSLSIVEEAAGKFLLRVPCAFCGGEHRAEIPAGSLLGKKTLVLSCPKTGAECCYLTEETAAKAAAQRLRQAGEMLDESAEGTFLNETVMHEVLSELREIAARNKISCTCGSRKWGMRVLYGSVELTCGECGAKLRIPAATDEDLDSLCCLDRITIRGAAGKS